MAASDSVFDDYGHLLELVEFAISQEREAVRFYTELARRDWPSAVAVELRRLAEMEQSHIDRLERLNLPEGATAPMPGIAGLKAADYAVAGELGPDASREDLLGLAIRQEIAAEMLYTDMANLVPDSILRQVLSSLAAEEVSHREYLEGVAGQGQ